MDDSHYNLREEKIIHRNERKNTAIALVTEGQRKYIDKYFSEASPEATKKAFEKECLIYKKSPRFSPRLERVYDHGLLIEFLEGESLGGIVFREKTSDSLLNSIFFCSLKFFDSIREDSGAISFSNFERYLSVLSSSGPVQNKNLSLGRSWFTIRIHRFLLYLMGSICKLFVLFDLKLCLVDYLRGFSHSDFHYNNIIIRENSAWFLDFERSKLEGYFCFDLIFLLVILETVNGENLRQKLSGSTKKILLGSAGKKLTYLAFKFAVSINRKFRKQ